MSTEQTTTPSISKKVGLEVSEKKTIHKIRITLMSKDVKSLEKVCADLIGETKKKNLKVSGPVRLPTKILRLVTRKSPCGEGTDTFDHFEMKIHKRLIDLQTSSDDVKDITSISIEPNVDIDVTVCDD